MDRRLSELVRVYDQALPARTCERMMTLFDKAHQGTTRREIKGLKSFNELVIDGLPEWMEYHYQLEQLKEKWFEHYRLDCPGIFPDRHDFEAFRIKRYAPESGDEFREHVDGYNAVSAKRFLVCFWYLNDVEEGGETIFTRLDLKVEPKQGRIIMFPPFWMYEHAALPPISNPKYIISTYFLFT